MGRVGLCMTIVVVGSVLWLLLVAGIVTSPVQAQRGSAMSMQVAATVSPQATPTKGQPAQQGTVQNEQVPSWVTLSLLFIGCAVLLAVLGFMLWFGGLLPWHRQSQPAGWRYEVLLALLAMLAAVVALAPQVFAAFTPPMWIRIVFLALAVVLARATAVVKLCSTQLEKERSWTRQVRGLLQVPLGADGKLPQLSALSPYELGASPTRYGSVDRRGDDPYVARRITDNELDEALRSYRFVLLVGDSKAGKSRTAYEAATRLQSAGRSHDPQVLFPKSTDVLRQLLDLDPPLDLHPEPPLLWLDNLTEGELEALTLALLDRLTAQMIVLGTMTAQRYDLVMRKDSDIGRTARLAVQHRATKVIRLEAGLTDQERAEAEQKYPQEQFRAGIGEQLVAVDDLTRRYNNAHQGANPHGWAVMQAAIDWTRMNVGRPISQHELVALCPLYLRAHHDDEGHKKALSWACDPVGSQIAPVEELHSDLDEPFYVPFDYLVAVADGQGGGLPQPILDSAWDRLLTLVSPSEAVRTGVSAYFRLLLPRAQKIFAAVAADSSDAAPLAASYLGTMLEERATMQEPRPPSSRPSTVVMPSPLPQRRSAWGSCWRSRATVQGAQAAYQRVIDSGHADVTPLGGGQTGDLLEKRGDLQEPRPPSSRPSTVVMPSPLPKRRSTWGPCWRSRATWQEPRSSTNVPSIVVMPTSPRWAPLAAVSLG